MRVVAVMRRRRQQQQPVGLARASTSASRRRWFSSPDAMMRLVDDHQVPRDAFQFRQHVILLGEIHRGQAQRGRVERIAAEFQAAPSVPQAGGVGDRR